MSVADPPTVIELGLSAVETLQEFRLIGPPKSFSTEVKDCEDRVWGRNVLTQPENLRVSRLTPPSMKSLVATWSGEVTSVLPSRQTQPPQPMMFFVLPLGAPLTPKEKAPKRGSEEVSATYCAFGKEVPGSQVVGAALAGGSVPSHDQM